jgi:hypothetical protein
MLLWRKMKTPYRIFAAAALALTAGALGGCYVEGEPARYAEEPDGEVVEYRGYRPQYYEGYVVYYDSYARPYYYARGVPYYVPRAYVGYGGLVRHYHTYRAVYPHWYARYGVRYRTYYRPYRYRR